jgi:hypothetical protein
MFTEYNLPSPSGGITKVMRNRVMKIRIAFTVEVDADEVYRFQESLDATDEDMRSFVRSYIISGGVGTLEEAMINNAFAYEAVRVVE